MNVVRVIKKVDGGAPKKTEAPVQSQLRENAINVLQASLHDKTINRRANVYEFQGLYRERGIDLDKKIHERAVTVKRDVVLDKFARGEHQHEIPAELAETLPLYANTPGRLGDYIQAEVTKTARPDDQGNSFIDFVVTIDNSWLLSDEAPKDAKDVPRKMTFLIDVTASTGLAYDKKIGPLRDEFLVRGKKANVLCYKDSFGSLGIERPKIIVAKTPEYIEQVGATLGGYIAKRASDSFQITNPSRFDEEYRKYFIDLMRGIRENAEQSIAYIEGLVPDQSRKALLSEYKKIAHFAALYEKTPAKRTLSQGSV